MTPKPPGNVVKEEKKKNVGTPSVKLFFKKVEKINKEPMAVQSMYIDEQSYSRADSGNRIQIHSR